MTSSEKTGFFRKSIRSWYQKHRRSLPWRGIRDPYRILISEVMLQQTQVDRVRVKYQQFLSRFPTLRALAAASQADVVRVWSGLGYNRRALNLLRAAREIVGSRRGIFPKTVADLKQLPGVGSYTAAAIGTFAFHRRVAAVDTNQRRLVGRFFFGLRSVPHPRIEAAALALVPYGPASARWNHALMDFGALVCRSRPRCAICPLADQCAAYPKILTAIRVGLKKPAEPFFGSNRYLRGRIIERLRSLPPHASLSEQTLVTELSAMPDVDADRLQTLIRQLATEGFLVVRKQKSDHRLRLHR